MIDEEDMDSENVNQGSQKGFRAGPEDTVEDVDPSEEEAPEDYPVRVSVLISKPKVGALHFETVAHGGQLMIESVYHYKDVAVAEGKTAEKSHERDTVYAGPPFSNLDEELQLSMERYLDERGVNAALAIFVPDYIEMKEQKEYMRWLENVQKFVEA